MVSDGSVGGSEGSLVGVQMEVQWEVQLEVQKVVQLEVRKVEMEVVQSVLWLGVGPKLDRKDKGSKKDKDE